MVLGTRHVLPVGSLRVNEPGTAPVTTRSGRVHLLLAHRWGWSRGGSGWQQLGDQLFDLGLDLVADRADGVEALAGDAIEVRSAGTAPKDQVNPVAVEAMAEVGIDITGRTPKVLTGEAVQVSDVVITMGCGDTCPFYPGTRYLDWPLDDPAGQGIDAVRPIRDAIKAKVEALISELLPDRAAV